MSKPKIDRVKLNQMLRSGKTQREAAQVFGVTEGAISKAKKELNISVVRSVALESAHKVVDKNLNTIGQLQKINNHANWLLDLLIGVNQGDNKSLEELKKLDLKSKNPHELALKAMAEIRNQLKLQLEIFQTMYDMRVVQEFQHEVLTTIAEASPEVRDDIIRRLQEKRSLRSTIQIN